MLIYEGNLQKKVGALSQLGAEKITFPPKWGWHTDRRTFATNKKEGHYQQIKQSDYLCDGVEIDKQNYMFKMNACIF